MFEFMTATFETPELSICVSTHLSPTCWNRILTDRSLVLRLIVYILLEGTIRTTAVLVAGASLSAPVIAVHSGVVDTFGLLSHL